MDGSYCCSYTITYTWVNPGWQWAVLVICLGVAAALVILLLIIRACRRKSVRGVTQHPGRVSSRQGFGKAAGAGKHAGRVAHQRPLFQFKIVEEAAEHLAMLRLVREQPQLLQRGEALKAAIAESRAFMELRAVGEVATPTLAVQWIWHVVRQPRSLAFLPACTHLSACVCVCLCAQVCTCVCTEPDPAPAHDEPHLLSR